MMRNFKKLVAVVAAIGVLGTAGAAFAATSKTPAEIVAGITGKTAEDVTKGRAAGETYCAIASDAGKLDEFKTQMLEQKKVVLDQRVKEGTITQQQADEAYNAIKNNQINCDETGKMGIGMKAGAGFGAGSCGMNNSQGQGNAQGKGMGKGMGGAMGSGRNSTK